MSVPTGEAIWLNPIVIVLFNVCNAVTVECCVSTRVARMCLVCLLSSKDKSTSPVSFQ